jgi:formiminoglutamase
LVGVAFAKGGEIALGTSSTPNAIRKALVRNTTYSHDYEVDMRKLKVRHAGDVEYHGTDISRSHYQIEAALFDLHRVTPALFVIALGGDGSIVAPSVRALARARDLHLGVIHFDGFHDVRDSAEVGPSDATSIRTLLEEDVIAGRNLVQIGLHGFANSPAERAYLEEHGTMVVPAREVRREGIESVLNRALAGASDGVDGVYVSVDANVLDASHAPFSYATSIAGLRAVDVQDAMFRLGADRRVLAMDLVGLDTYDDPKEYMARVGVALLLAFLAGYSTRTDSTDRAVGHQ